MRFGFLKKLFETKTTTLKAINLKNFELDILYVIRLYDLDSDLKSTKKVTFQVDFSILNLVIIGVNKLAFT